MIEFSLLLWGAREGHWLLPIQGGHVSKQTAPICRLLTNSDFTARGIGIIGREGIGHKDMGIGDIGFRIISLYLSCNIVNIGLWRITDFLLENGSIGLFRKTGHLRRCLCLVFMRVLCTLVG